MLLFISKSSRFLSFRRDNRRYLAAAAKAFRKGERRRDEIVDELVDDNLKKEVSSLENVSGFLKINYVVTSIKLVTSFACLI
jgi:hypothetical protein